jgi:uncharacterized protein (TIGR00730 family)
MMVPCIEPDPGDSPLRQRAGGNHGSAAAGPREGRPAEEGSSMKSVCVFCGSSLGVRNIYGEAARRLGYGLAEDGIDIVYGGGGTGLMGELAASALAAGGRVTGVIPAVLAEREGVQAGLTALHVVADFCERKRMMAELAEGFIALPGGYGTLEEILEVLSRADLGLHRKPCGLLDVAGFFQPLLDLLDDAVAAGFLRRESRNQICVKRRPEELIAAIRTYGTQDKEKK